MHWAIITLWDSFVSPGFDEGIECTLSGANLQRIQNLLPAQTDHVPSPLYAVNISLN